MLNKEFSTTFFATSFFYNKAFGPFKQPTNRQNTILSMLTLRATLKNVRENKINRQYFFCYCGYEALHNDNNHMKTQSSLPNRSLKKVL